MTQYIPKYKSWWGKVKVKLHLSTYATKEDLNNKAGVNTSTFAKKVDLASLKSGIDKLDTFKLETAPYAGT